MKKEEEHKPVSKGKTWVKKANSYVIYECFNTKGISDKFQWVNE